MSDTTSTTSKQNFGQRMKKACVACALGSKSPEIVHGLTFWVMAKRKDNNKYGKIGLRRSEALTDDQLRRIVEIIHETDPKCTMEMFN